MARARGVGRSSGKGYQVCRLGGARPSPAVHFASMALFVSAERQQQVPSGQQFAGGQ